MNDEFVIFNGERMITCPTPEERLGAIRGILKKQGYTLEVVNMPKRKAIKKKTTQNK